MKTKTLLLFSTLLVMSCNDDNTIESQQEDLSSTVITCEDFQSVQTKNGLLYNNVWNKQADKNQSGTQCLKLRLINGNKQYGWSWKWPEGERVIFSYPQIKVGSSPWQPKPSFNDKFPAKISALKTLKLSYNLETLTNSNFNIAASMWVTKTLVTGDQPKPSSIAAEIMVWTYASQNHFSPAGQKIDEITVGKNTWEVWVDNNWKDASGANTNKWVYIAFKSTSNSVSQNIDMLGLLNYAISKQLIQPDYYVADIELGNEVMGGFGTTWINSFNVSVQ